jgi:hypothetical protein
MLIENQDERSALGRFTALQVPRFRVAQSPARLAIEQKKVVPISSLAQGCEGDA